MKLSELVGCLMVDPRGTVNVMASKKSVSLVFYPRGIIPIL